jgi:hypothetical protein
VLQAATTDTRMDANERGFSTPSPAPPKLPGDAEGGQTAGPVSGIARLT